MRTSLFPCDRIAHAPPLHLHNPIESRDSQMESTKTIALAIHSVDQTSLFPYSFL